jgi:hypothetical protein
MEIELILAQFGAQAILKEYDSTHNPIAISFIMTFENKKMPFKLPLKIESARKVIEEAIKAKKLPKKFRQEPLRTEKALIVGWRIIKDWIHSQLSLLEMHYAEPIEIFLPYLYNPIEKKTFYEKLSENNFKALPFIENDKN